MSLPTMLSAPILVTLALAISAGSAERTARPARWSSRVQTVLDTDFAGSDESVELAAPGKGVLVGAAPGRCQFVRLTE